MADDDRRPSAPPVEASAPPVGEAAPPASAPPPVAAWLKRLGYAHVHALPPGEELQIGEVSVNAAPATHKGNRYGFDRWRSDHKRVAIARVVDIAAAHGAHVRLIGDSRQLDAVESGQNRRAAELMRAHLNNSKATTDIEPVAIAAAG